MARGDRSTRVPSSKKDETMLPKARKDKLTVRELADETLVYDLERSKAHCLNRTAATVWQHCNGRTTLADLDRVLQAELEIDDARPLVRLALEQLSRRHLLEQPVASASEATRRSRRDLLKKLVAAAVVLPAVMTIAAPKASAAASVSCRSDADCSSLNANGGCVVGQCQAGRCAAVSLNSGSCTGCQGSVCVCSNGSCRALISDRNAKDNFATIDAEDILARLAAVPIETWNYKGESPAIRHIGPMAQDFAAAFAVGVDDKHIHPIDASGVAFAAIQALYQKLLEKDRQINALERRMKRLTRKTPARRS